MRNVDKIEELQKELRRYQKKAADDAKVIARLRQELDGVDEGIRQLSAAADATITEILLACKKPAKDGSIKLECPVVSVRRNKRDWVLTVDKMDAEQNVLRLVPTTEEQREAFDKAFCEKAERGADGKLAFPVGVLK